MNFKILNGVRRSSGDFKIALNLKLMLIKDLKIKSGIWSMWDLM